MGIFSKLFSKNPPRREGLACEIIDIAILLGSRCNETYPPSVEDKRYLGRAVHEFVYFYLHIVNRLAYTRGGKKEQERIYDQVVNGVGNELADRFGGENRVAYIDYFADKIIETEKVYAACKGLVPEDGRGYEKTLYWEGAKRIAESQDIARITFAFELLSIGLQELKLEETRVERNGIFHRS